MERSKLKALCKRILKVLGIVLGAFVIFVILYFAVEWCLSRITVNFDPATPEQALTIYARSNGAHVDIVVPVRSEIIDWSGFVTTDDTLGKDASAGYVAFGWGDKGFYMDIDTWDELTFPIAFRAVFALSTAAMHVTFYREMGESDLCKGMTVGREEYARLVRYILDSFRKDAAGRPIYIETDAQYGEDDAFYEAYGRYNLFFTCNTWANKALKTCGQKAAVWTVFDTGILRHYSD